MTQLDFAAVALRNLFAHPQAQPGANIFLGGEKWLKDMSAVFLRDTRSIVCNLYLHSITLLRRGHGDADLSARRYRVRGVGDQVRYQLFDFALQGMDRRTIR